MPEPTPNTREALIDTLIASWGKGTFRSLRQAAGRDVDTLLTALATDPGDLPARMREAVLTFFGHDGVGRTDTTVKWAEAIAAAALSVRWEHAAQLAARVGDAERRAEHAESEHQVTQERLDHARRRLDQLRAYARWCTARSVEPEERDILELADGAHRDDYVALMADAPDGGE